MPQVVVAGPLHAKGRVILDRAAGIGVTYVEETSEQSLAARIHTADAVLLRTQPLTERTVALAPRLKVVSRHGVGYDAVEVPALTRRNIALAVCGDVNATSVAEHAVMMILATAKRAVQGDRAVRTGPWEWRNRLQSRDVRGQSLLLVGYGRIGRQVARMMAPFGVTIRAYDPFLAQTGWPDGDVPPVASLEQGLGWADIVSFSAPHTGAPLIGAPEFTAMKDGVVLINTARGGLIDEVALITALDSGKVGAAGLDVFASEPPIDTPLARFDQVLLSPHIAGLTQDAAERMAVGSAQNILDFFNGVIDPALVVNRKELDGRG